MPPTPDSARQLLRHTVAAVAYRAGKALRGAPDHFASFHIGDKTRTPAQILAHMGDLFDWGLSIAQGQQTWHDSTPLPWNAEVERFFAAMKKRSEEHTSELQSRLHLVCRLLLEKKKIAPNTRPATFLTTLISGCSDDFIIGF